MYRSLEGNYTENIIIHSEVLENSNEMTSFGIQGMNKHIFSEKDSLLSNEVKLKIDQAIEDFEKNFADMLNSLIGFRGIDIIWKILAFGVSSVTSAQNFMFGGDGAKLLSEAWHSSQSEEEFFTWLEKIISGGINLAINSSSADSLREYLQFSIATMKKKHKIPSHYHGKHWKYWVAKVLLFAGFCVALFGSIVPAGNNLVLMGFNAKGFVFATFTFFINTCNYTRGFKNIFVPNNNKILLGTGKFFQEVLVANIRNEVARDNLENYRKALVETNRPRNWKVATDLLTILITSGMVLPYAYIVFVATGGDLKDFAYHLGAPKDSAAVNKIANIASYIGGPGKFFFLVNPGLIIFNRALRWKFYHNAVNNVTKYPGAKEVQEKLTTLNGPKPLRLTAMLLEILPAGLSLASPLAFVYMTILKSFFAKWLGMETGDEQESMDAEVNVTQLFWSTVIATVGTAFIQYYDLYNNIAKLITTICSQKGMRDFYKRLKDTEPENQGVLFDPLKTENEETQDSELLVDMKYVMFKRLGKMSMLQLAMLVKKAKYVGTYNDTSGIQKLASSNQFYVSFAEYPAVRDWLNYFSFGWVNKGRPKYIVHKVTLSPLGEKLLTAVSNNRFGQDNLGESTWREQNFAFN